MNPKQLKYSRKKVQTALQQTRLKAFLYIILAFAVPAAIYAVTHADSSKESVTTVTAAAMLSMAAIGNVDGVADNEVAGEALNYKVWLIHYSQINHSVPFPQPGAMREIGALPLKPGEKMHYFEAHDIPQYVGSGERGDLTTSGTNTFTIIMGGVRDQLLDFVENYAGGKFIIIFQECGINEKYIAGTACKPMVLKSYSVTNNKENRSVSLTFENKSIRQYYKYAGSISEAAPVLHAADSSTLTIQAGVDTYRIPDGSSATYAISAFSGVGAADVGRYITLLGEGTTKAATVAETSGIVLADGATWTAKAGSSITFRIFDQSTLVETSRIQTA